MGAEFCGVGAVIVVIFRLYLRSCTMELDEQREAERFVEEFKQIDFQVPFDNLKRETVAV